MIYNRVHIYSILDLIFVWWYCPNTFFSDVLTGGTRPTLTKQTKIEHLSL
jgi:hypothetical protein